MLKADGTYRHRCVVKGKTVLAFTWKRLDGLAAKVRNSWLILLVA